MKPKSPCMYCEARYIGCHGECEAYLHYKDEWAKIKTIISEAKHKEREYRACAIRRVGRA